MRTGDQCKRMNPDCRGSWLNLRRHSYLLSEARSALKGEVRAADRRAAAAGPEAGRPLTAQLRAQPIQS